MCKVGTAAPGRQQDATCSRQVYPTFNFDVVSQACQHQPDALPSSADASRTGSMTQGPANQDCCWPCTAEAHLPCSPLPCALQRSKVLAWSASVILLPDVHKWQHDGCTLVSTYTMTEPAVLSDIKLHLASNRLAGSCRPPLHESQGWQAEFFRGRTQRRGNAVNMHTRMLNPLSALLTTL